MAVAIAYRDHERGRTDRFRTRRPSVALGALRTAVFVQIVPEEPHFLLYGPGFEVRITRTDPSADYPGKPA